MFGRIRDLFKEIYVTTSTFPSKERFNIIDQLRRSVTSISINIAEGSGRRTKKDELHFTNVAYSSLMEVLNLIIFSKDLSYISDANYIKIRQQIDAIAKQLNALSKAQKMKI